MPEQDRQEGEEHHVAGNIRDNEGNSGVISSGYLCLNDNIITRERPCLTRLRIALVATLSLIGSRN